MHQVVFALNGRQRTYGMRPAYSLGTYFTHTPVLHLALLHQLGDGLRHLLGRSIGVGTVLVEHRECFKFQTAERIFTVSTYRFAAAVLTSRTLAVDYLVSEFGRHVDFAPELGEGFACQILVGQRPVDDRRVEKRYATLHGFVQQTDTLLFVGVLTAVVGHAHHAEAESGDFEGCPARAECAMRKSMIPSYRFVPFGNSRSCLYLVKYRFNCQCRPCKTKRF